jgi:DMSO/TMAO reductase YedYZ molybdopterin-dependent catalytic subunit
VIRAATAPDYRLTVTGKVARPLAFRLDEVLALPARRAYLPIACVEGWSYTATWTGVPLGELLRLAGASSHASARVHSLEQHSIYAVSYVDHFQAGDDATLLATHLDGRRLSLDHGFPLRLIGPNRAGVTQTKWVTEVEVT